MASAGLNFANLTPDNGAVKSLKELVFLAVNDPQSIGGIVNVMPKQYNGDKIGFVGEFDALGKKADGCNVVYDSNVISATEKTWDIAEVEIPLALCYKDLVATLAKTALKTKTSIDDLTGTEYLSDVVEPRLELAWKKMLYRIAFFGDKSASVYHSSDNTSGTLKVGMDAKYFNMLDGFWTKLFKGVAEGKVRRVSVSANASTSASAQKAAIKGAGVATGIIDEMITSASAKLRQQAGQRIYVTQALADALTLDYRHSNIGSNLQWEALAEGISITRYSGVEIVALPVWDEIIQTMLQNTTNATADDKPYRAIYTTQENLLLGTPSENELAQFDVTFDPISRKNYIYAKDAYGVEIAQDDLVVVAY